MSAEPIVVTIDSDLEDLIPGFIGRRHEDVAKMYRAIDEEDMKTLRVTGHSLKGTGGGYGFDGLSDIGARIETAAVEKDLNAVREQLAALEDYLARVQVQFQ